MVNFSYPMRRRLALCRGTASGLVAVPGCRVEPWQMAPSALARDRALVGFPLRAPGARSATEPTPVWELAEKDLRSRMADWDVEPGR